MPTVLYYVGDEGHLELCVLSKFLVMQCREHEQEGDWESSFPIAIRETGNFAPLVLWQGKPHWMQQVHTRKKGETINGCIHKSSPDWGQLRLSEGREGGASSS